MTHSTFVAVVKVYDGSICKLYLNCYVTCANPIPPIFPTHSFNLEIL